MTIETKYNPENKAWMMYNNHAEQVEIANKVIKYFQKIVIFFCTSFPPACLSLKQRAQAHNGAFAQVRENGPIC